MGNEKDKTMTTAFDKIMAGLKDALAHAKGGKGAASSVTETKADRPKPDGPGIQVVNVGTKES